MAPCIQYIFENTYSGVTVFFQVHCEPKHLSWREIKLAHYLISSYCGARTVEIHSAAHANPAYRSSNTGQRLQHTLPYNPHKYIAVRMGINMCVTERERERRKWGREHFSMPQPQWSACSVTIVGRIQQMHHDVASHSWNSYDKDRFFSREKPWGWSVSSSLQYHTAIANVYVWMGRGKKSVYFVFFWSDSKENIRQAWPLTHALTQSHTDVHTKGEKKKNEGWWKVTGKQIQCHILLLSSLCHLAF